MHINTRTHTRTHTHTHTHTNTHTHTHTQVHQSVLDAGDKESGCTVHQVIEEVDGGEVVVQMRVDVVPGETAQSLKGKVQQLEGESLIRACEMFYYDRTLPGDTDAAAKKALLDGADRMDE